ncbi:hypothetical protein ABIB68_006596 [Bradyrhizobium sp. F1.2.2]
MAECHGGEEWSNPESTEPSFMRAGARMKAESRLSRFGQVGTAK